MAQVGRSIAELLLYRADTSLIAQLGGLCADVVEAAGLAHDIGHPPFGHIGEAILDRYARMELDLPEGFEGNAQTFRVLTRLEPKSRHTNGLNLTAASRAAVLKYPWFREGEQYAGLDDADLKRRHKLHWEKFGAYADDADAFETARIWVPLPSSTQSVEAAIMDVADDITYALHDLEDFYGARLLDLRAAHEELRLWRRTYLGTKLLPLSPLVENAFEALRSKLARDYPRRFVADEFDEAATAVEQHLVMLQQERVGTRRAQANAGRFVSSVITDFLSGLRVYESPGEDQPPVQLSSSHWHVTQVLKEITRVFVIQRADFAVIQRGQQTMLQELLTHLRTWCDEDNERLPGTLLEGLPNSGYRALIDFVSALNDDQASALHRSLTGYGPQSLATNFLP